MTVIFGLPGKNLHKTLHSQQDGTMTLDGRDRFMAQLSLIESGRLLLLSWLQTIPNPSQQGQINKMMLLNRQQYLNTWKIITHSITELRVERFHPNIQTYMPAKWRNYVKLAELWEIIVKNLPKETCKPKWTIWRANDNESI